MQSQKVKTKTTATKKPTPAPSSTSTQGKLVWHLYRYYFALLRLWWKSKLVCYLLQCIWRWHAFLFCFDDRLFIVDKNSKETFIKKLHLCSKIYDYKDETKDVKGKVSSLSKLISSDRRSVLMQSRSSSRCSVTKRMWPSLSSRTLNRWCLWLKRTSLGRFLTLRNRIWRSPRQALIRTKKWTLPGHTCRVSTNSFCN